MTADPVIAILSIGIMAIVIIVIAIMVIAILGTASTDIVRIGTEATHIGIFPWEFRRNSDVEARFLPVMQID